MPNLENRVNLRFEPTGKASAGRSQPVDDQSLQPWHDEDWGKRFVEAVERRGYKRKSDFARAVDWANSTVTRLGEGRATLPETLEACKELNLALPPGICNPVQLRLLLALERLSAALEERFPKSAASSILAFVAEVEELAEQKRPPEAVKKTDAGPDFQKQE